jgi:hypothetical protein
LIALLRKRIFPGSMKMLASGRRLAATRKSTPASSTVLSPSTAGAIA